VFEFIERRFAQQIKDFFPTDTQIFPKFEQLYKNLKASFVVQILALPFSFSLHGLLPKIAFASQNTGASGAGYQDPRFKRVLWYLIGSTKGGANRAKIIDLLNTQPANANQIATDLNLDYKTVIHHLKALSDNGLIVTENKESYGATYFLTPLMEKNFESFKEILVKIGKK
jgi:DNA-binding transcriptional ArsR family regulator